MFASYKVLCCTDGMSASGKMFLIITSSKSSPGDTIYESKVLFEFGKCTDCSLVYRRNSFLNSSEKILHLSMDL